MYCDPQGHPLSERNPIYYMDESGDMLQLDEFQYDMICEALVALYNRELDKLQDPDDNKILIQLFEIFP